MRIFDESDGGQSRIKRQLSGEARGADRSRHPAAARAISSADGELAERFARWRFRACARGKFQPEPETIVEIGALSSQQQE